MNKKISNVTIISAALVVMLFALLFVLEKVMSPYAVLFVVLK